ncbi:hypothetical protein JND45_15135, partial [Listeria monocytogenes]|uniref:hypothetical protein n=1 Tax=Listeria monocytogenes TaxID=1639 RepID=UPI001A9217F2
MMKRSMTVAMLAGTAIGLSVPAWAQDAATTASATTDKPQPELPIGDIVVTAQRRSQRLQDVPIAVSVVAGADLERSNLRSLQDVTERLPNVKIVS